MSRPRPRKHTIRVLLLLVVSFAIALLVSEAGLRLIFPALSDKGYTIWAPHLKRVFEPSPEVMPGISGPSRFEINSMGLRGDEPEPSDTYRILALGGSTTECVYLDQTEAWPFLLQEALNRSGQAQTVWVGNAGKSGRDTWHHLAAMQYLPLDEMGIDTVIMLVGINDLTTRLAQDVDYDPNPMEKPNAEQWLLVETFEASNLLRPGEPWFKDLALWRLLQRLKAPRRQVNDQDRTGRIYMSWREHRRTATDIRDELPDLSSALETYASNLNKIIDVAHERSVRLILVTQPAMWRPDLPEDIAALLWMGGIGDFQTESGRPYYSVDALDKAMQAYNDTLLQVCQDRQVECFDLASMLEKDTTVFFDDVHFNESGARKVAATLRGVFVDGCSFRWQITLRRHRSMHGFSKVPASVIPSAASGQALSGSNRSG